MHCLPWRWAWSPIRSAGSLSFEALYLQSWERQNVLGKEENPGFSREHFYRNISGKLR